VDIGQHEVETALPQLGHRLIKTLRRLNLKALLPKPTNH
jgi:hypothetical protein